MKESPFWDSDHSKINPITEKEFLFMSIRWFILGTAFMLVINLLSGSSNIVRLLMILGTIFLYILHKRQSSDSKEKKILNFFSIPILFGAVLTMLSTWFATGFSTNQTIESVVFGVVLTILLIFISIILYKMNLNVIILNLAIFFILFLEVVIFYIISLPLSYEVEFFFLFLPALLTYTLITEFRGILSRKYAEYNPRTLAISILSLNIIFFSIHLNLFQQAF